MNGVQHTNNDSASGTLRKVQDENYWLLVEETALNLMKLKLFKQYSNLMSRIEKSRSFCSLEDLSQVFSIALDVVIDDYLYFVPTQSPSGVYKVIESSIPKRFPVGRDSFEIIIAASLGDPNVCSTVPARSRIAVGCVLVPVLGDLALSSPRQAVRTAIATLRS